MKKVLTSLFLDVIRFFISYAILFIVVSRFTENLPRSWDPTGMGMLALIILFVGFVICSFKVGAAYSDDPDIKAPGSLLHIFKRPVRSFKYGLISLLLSFLLLYVVMVVSDFVMN